MNVLKTYAIGSHQTFRDFVKLPIWGPIRIVIMSNMKKIELCNLVCICQASDFFRGPTKNVSYLRSSEYTFTFHTVGFRSKFFNRGPTGFGTPPPRPHFISKPLSRRVPSNMEHIENQRPCLIERRCNDADPAACAQPALSTGGIQGIPGLIFTP